MADFGSKRFSATGLYPGFEAKILKVSQESYQSHPFLAILFNDGNDRPMEGISLSLRRLYQAKTVRRIVNNAEQEAATVATPSGSLVDRVKEKVTTLGPGATNDQVREALNTVLPGKTIRIDTDFEYVDSFHKVKVWFKYDLLG
jgi:hypothetical protein